jgi:hypothetical protein
MRLLLDTHKKLTLVSADAILDAYGVTRLW